MTEHVSQKAKGPREPAIRRWERAIVEAKRLNEMVWNMDVQINRLNEGAKEAYRSEETIGRIETLVQQTQRDGRRDDKGPRRHGARVGAVRKGWAGARG